MSWSRAHPYNRILLWWGVSRGLVLLTALAVSVAGHPHGSVDSQLLHEPFGPLGSWDGVWYRTVAAHGYLLVPGHYSNPAFFPLFPALLTLGGAFGISAFYFGIAVSNLAFLAALVLLFELGRGLLDAGDALRASLVAAVFPLGYVFSMGYPEALAFALVAGAALLGVRGRWLGAAVLIGLAVLARPEALFVALPLGAAARQQWRALSRRQRQQAVAAIAAGPISLLSFLAYLGWTLDDPLAWTKAQHAWGRSFGAEGAINAFAGLGSSLAHHPWLVRDLVFFVVYCCLLVVAWRAGIARSWLAAGALVLFVPLASGTFASESRFGLLALPVYWGLAIVARPSYRLRAIQVVGLALLAVGTTVIPLAFP